MIATKSKYIRAGHAALQITGHQTVIDGPTKRKALIQEVDRLDYLDRLVDGQEFADITGLNVINGIAPKLYKPRRIRKKVRRWDVRDFRIDKS
jgi:hypothetical protein